VAFVALIGRKKPERSRSSQEEEKSRISTKPLKKGKRKEKRRIPMTSGQLGRDRGKELSILIGGEWKGPIVKIS